MDGKNSPLITGIGAQTELVQGGGKGGNINIDTMELLVVNGGDISASTFGSGAGGTLAITAKAILVDGKDSQFPTGIFAETQWIAGGGMGGDILIDTTELQVINGGGIGGSTLGSGDAGTLTITAKTILVDRQNSQFGTGIIAENRVDCWRRQGWGYHH